MNKDRRGDLSSIYAAIERAKERLEVVLDEEQEYIDNMPDNLQSSEKCELAEEAVSNMEEAVDDLEAVLELIEEAMA